VLAVTFAEVDEEARLLVNSLAGVVAALLITRGECTDAYTTLRRSQKFSLAAEIQWQLLPPLSLDAGRLSVAGLIHPAYDVGGDSFDYAHAVGRLDVGIFDAVGHDLGATVICGLAVGAYRNARRGGEDLIGCARAMDAALLGQMGRGAFTTGQIGTLDTDSGVFRWLNAGHPLPLLVRDGHVRPLECRPRLPFGLGDRQPGRSWDIAEDQLQPGDGVLLYTDGVVEARKPGGEDYGVDRLMELLRTSFAAGLQPQETLRRLSHAVVDFHDGVLRDDATNLLMVWRPGHR
jgi:serine phosphatase RsbU (regulator of sigma subunit)